MTILLGSSAGADDYGRQRTRGPTTPATAISIFVGRSSRGTFDGELTIVNDAYITVWDDRRVWAKMPFIDDVGGIFKDSDLEVGDRTTLEPPVANMGAGFASTIDADTSVITVLHNGQLSYAVADGATITDYLWDIADGTLLAGTLTDDNITVTYPAGFRYTKLTVTDSNGKVSFTERPVFADELDHSLSLDGFQIESHRITDAGQTMTIRALQDMPRATYPDGTLAIIWARDSDGAANRDNLLIIGWLDVDDAAHNAGRTGLLRDTTLTILDVAAKLDTLPGFPQALADDETRDTELIPDITWNYMIAPTIDKYMHYLWAWHSTALEVADFFWSDTGTAYQVAIKSSDGESLWNQLWRTAQQMCPGYVLTCDQAGAIRVVPDPMLQELDDRTAVVQTTITEDNWSNLRFTYQRAPRTHWLRTGALVVQSSISFNADGTVFLPTVFSIAPGDTPGQGLGEVDNNEQLATDQATLNNATGHRYARMNAPVTTITVTLIQDDQLAGGIRWREIEPALKQWVVLTVTAETAAQRGWPWTSTRCLAKEVTPRYNHSRTGLTRTLEVTLEPETSGQPAATHLMPTSIPAPGDQPATIPDPIPPPDMGLILGQQLVAGIGTTSLYRTADFQTPSGSGGPTWEAIALTADATQTWVVDPFSPGYLMGVGAINGWRATTTKLYRMTDLFGAFAETPVVTFATTALWRTVQASFGAYFNRGSNPWLICISYYGSTGGHTGTWCTYSKDGGVTWFDEVQITTDHDDGGASNPIGVYASPKTPGLAYTIAHNETANPAETGGYKSTDWGETWTAMTAAEDPVELLPYWGIYTDHYDGTTFEEIGIAPSATLTVTATSTGPVETDNEDLNVFIPADARQVKMTVNWSNESTSTGGGGSQGSGLDPASISGITRTGGSNYTQATLNAGKLSGSFDLTYDFPGYATGDWPDNRETWQPSPPTTTNEGMRFFLHVGADANAPNTRMTTATISITVTEITLDDGTVYAPTTPGIFIPVHGQGGEIHVPWPSNADENVIYYGSLDRSGSPVIGLQRVDAGVVTDISKTVYGINSGHFAVRTFDGDRSFALLAGESGAGNSGVWTSVDNGDTWTQIVAPSAVTHYQAAFGGDSELIVYIWGPAGYIKYSEDMGTSLDDRSGNLSGLSATKLVGIAGGPTP